MRIVVLLLITGALSWYSHQGSNNPFAPKSELTIKGSDSSYVIYFIRGSRKHRFMTLFIPSSLGRDGQELLSEVTGNWDLITLDEDINPDHFVPPPQHWTVLDPGSSSGSAQKKDRWPQPTHSVQASSQGTAMAKIVSPFLDQRRAVLLSPGSLSVLICDSSVFSSTQNQSSPFLEKLDLLIIPPASEQTAREMRGVFRPRLLVIIPPCQTQYSMENILCSQGKNWKYDFVITPQNRLKPKY